MNFRLLNTTSISISVYHNVPITINNMHSYKNKNRKKKLQKSYVSKIKLTPEEK